MSGIIVRCYPFSHVIDSFEKLYRGEPDFLSDLQWWTSTFFPLDPVSLWQPGIESHIGFRSRNLCKREAERLNLVMVEPVVRVTFLGSARIRTFAHRLIGEPLTHQIAVEGKYRWQFRQLLYGEFSILASKIRNSIELQTEIGLTFLGAWESLLYTPPNRLDFQEVSEDDLRYRYEQSFEEKLDEFLQEFGEE